MWYFRKDSGGGANGLRVTISTGAVVQFEAINWDVGVYPPEGRGISEGLANEFRRLIAEQRGGITEIPLEAYNALLAEKKTNPDGLKAPQREEIRKQHRPEGNIVQLASPLQTNPPSTPPSDAAGLAGKAAPRPPFLPPGPTSTAAQLPTEAPRPVPIAKPK